MNVECYDSPFYNAVESSTDRLIQEVKKRYSGFLRDLLVKIKDIQILEIVHSMMSCYISVLFKWSCYEIRVNYDMDKKEFAEPRISFGMGLSMRDGYLFTKEDLSSKIITVFAKFYEVSQMEGCGTRFGGNFDIGQSVEMETTDDLYLNKEDTNQMARKEYERLREENRKYMVKKQKEIDERRRRDVEFIRKIGEKRN